jgi:hypothetical protein
MIYSERKSGGSHHDVEYFFDKDKIVSNYQDIKTEFEWKTIKQVRETKEVFHFHAPTAQGPRFFVPKRAFTASQMQEFITLLKEKKLLAQ